MTKPAIVHRDLKPENVSGEHPFVARRRRAAERKARAAEKRKRGPRRQTRLEILSRDDYRCKKCGFHSPDGKLLQLNHVKPWSSGGLTTAGNLDALCVTCHNELSWLWSDDPPVSYERWLETVPAVALLKSLLVVAAEIEPPKGFTTDACGAFTGLSRDQARWLLFGPRS